MAIYFNDKLLTPKEDGNELEMRYFRELKEVEALIKENDGTLTLKRDVNRIWDADKVSFRPTVPFALPTEISIYLEELGAVTVRYSEYPPQKQGNRITWPMTRLMMGELVHIPMTKKDLAWYLLKATTFVGSLLVIDNPKAEIKVKASEVKRIARVDGYLLNDDSPLINLESMQFIADKFGIDIGKTDAETAGYIIREYVLSADKAKNPEVNIEKFIALAERMTRNSDFKPKDSYTKEELEGLTQKELNVIAKLSGVPCPPQCKRVEQVEKLLELQPA